jgi:hypothetical protein
MVTVEADPVRVESRLAVGGIGCPTCRDGVLGGWGYARARQLWPSSWMPASSRSHLGYVFTATETNGGRAHDRLTLVVGEASGG